LFWFTHKAKINTAYTSKETKTMGSIFSKENDMNQDQALFYEYCNTDRFHDLNDKVVAITGTSANSLGFFLGEVAIRKNVKLLLLLNRDSETSRAGKEGLEKILADNADYKTEIKSIKCDLMDFHCVKDAGKQVNEITKQYGGLDVLICNSGIMAKNDERTDAGFDIQMQTNQISHFLLVSIVYPMLELAGKNRGDARLVMHSSGARFFPKKNLEQKYFEKCKPGTLGGNRMMWDFLGRGGPWTRYHMTKLSNACFAMEMHHRLKKLPQTNNVMALAADPGVASSGLYGSATSGNGAMSGILARLLMGTGQSTADGSLPAAMAAFSDQALSGDFWAPRFQRKGAPIKTIEETSDVEHKSREKLTLTTANQENVWKWCEEALDIKFQL